MQASPLSSVATVTNLRRLFWLRLFMAFLLGLAAFSGVHFYALEIPILPLCIAGIALLVCNVLTWRRMRKSTEVGPGELFAQLMLDLLLLTAVFYMTGGYSNPFVWMYLLPLAVAAVALPRMYTWGVACISIAAYSALMFWYRPLVDQHASMHASMVDMPVHHMHEQNGFSLHLLGMWAGFVVSALLIAYFVERMSRNLREHDQLIAEARERMLEIERMLSLGAMAAGAAHELGTPLSTTALLLEELSDQVAHDAELEASVKLMRQQIVTCKQILSSMAATAGELRAESGTLQPVSKFLDDLLQRWQDRRPATPLEQQVTGTGSPPEIIADRALGQALTNLLDNAADASPKGIEARFTWTADMLQGDIKDHGPGIPLEIWEQLGQPGFTTKEGMGGLGLGVFLARSIIERLGGSLAYSAEVGGGTVVHIALPLVKLRGSP